MAPKRDIKRATEENMRRQKVEEAKKRAKEREVEAKKKAEEKNAMKAAKAREVAKAMQGRKIKEENIEKNKKVLGVSIIEPSGTSRKSSLVEDNDPQGKSKRSINLERLSCGGTSNN